jgi:poly-beta-1,6-N-acetyl-D-glucosamine synthase
MLLYFYLIFFLYFVFVLVLRKGWESISVFQDTAASDYFVSIIVVVRNEEKNIQRLLASIAVQTYAHDKFELIVIDDQSEDGTRSIILDFINKAPYNIRLMETSPEMDQKQSPKMYALKKAIDVARGDIIATTDGDCRMGQNWLKIMTAPFQHEKIQFVSGPVAFEETNSLMSKIQSLEFSSLIGSGAAMIQWGYPLMCNGANLAFRKKAYLQVNGYDGVYQSVTGDDVYLMQKIHSHYKDAVTFAGSPDALVFTESMATISGFVHQRKRWASKWSRHLLPYSWAIPVFLFAHYLSFAMLAVLIFVVPGLMIHGILFIILKFVSDYLFLKKITDFCRLPMNFWVFIITELLYPFYALSVGVLVHFGRWSWKGRKYS